MAEDKDKQQDFVVTDKRKFTCDGERRPDAPEKEEDEGKPSAPPATVEPQQPPQPPSAPATPPPEGSMPTHPSAEQQRASQDAYRKSGKKLDEMLQDQLGGKAPQDFEMTFEKVVISFYMTAMMQLGLLRREGEQPQADLVGARQTIDTIGILSDKTKGNLTEAEQTLLQNCLFELRMAFLEITNAITRGPAPGGSGSIPGPGGMPGGQA